MNSIIVYFLPSVIGLSLYLYLNKEKQSIYNEIKQYLIFVVVSNYLCSIIDIIKNKFEYNLTYYIDNNLVFSTKYLTLLIVVNILLAFIFTIIKKYISVTVEVKKHEKKD